MHRPPGAAIRATLWAMRDPDVTARRRPAPVAVRAALAAALALLVVRPAPLAAVDEPAPSLPVRIAICESCHGRHGQSPDPDVPVLAGQSAAYLQRQLEAFRSGTRQDPAMSAIARTLDAASVDALARHFAAQPAAWNGFTADPARAAAGAALVERHGCAACHATDFAGGGAVPRLAGQHPAYLLRQMHAWREGRRSSPVADMRALLAPLSEEALEAIAEHFGRLGAPSPAPPPATPPRPAGG